MPTGLKKNFSSTAVGDYAALRYPPISGIVVPINTYPDAADGGIVIPMGLTSYGNLSSKPTTATIDTMPILNPNDSGFAVGGRTVSYGSSELGKMMIEGRIDTPTIDTIVSGELLSLPSPTFNGMKVTYADIIAACLEGRANLATTAIGSGVTLENMWTRVDPTWFRDPVGRVYNNPKITNFTASYVEQVPARVTFQMTLQVQPYDY